MAAQGSHKSFKIEKGGGKNKENESLNQSKT